MGYLQNIVFTRPIQKENNLFELDLFIKLIQNKDLSLVFFSINTVNKFLVKLSLCCHSFDLEKTTILGRATLS